MNSDSRFLLVTFCCLWKKWLPVAGFYAVSLMAYWNFTKIADNSKSVYHHQKTSLMGWSEWNSKILKVFGWSTKLMLPKSYQNLLPTHQHVKDTILTSFRTSNSNFKGGAFSDADRPRLAEAPISFDLRVTQSWFDVRYISWMKEGL